MQTMGSMKHFKAGIGKMWLVRWKSLLTICWNGYEIGKIKNQEACAGTEGQRGREKKERKKKKEDAHHVFECTVDNAVRKSRKA